MNLNERVKFFDNLFEMLQSTNSRNQKEFIIKQELKDKDTSVHEDWRYILEVLDNRHPLGFRFSPVPNDVMTLQRLNDTHTIKELIEPLTKLADYTQERVYIAEFYVGDFGCFIEPIVNRTLRLGIGKSLLSKTDITPMLAKKYEPTGILNQDVAITEKLDGNRCIATWDGEKWNFTSRSGKPMKVNFDMTGMPTEFIYDGEVMSTEQTWNSIVRTKHIFDSDIDELEMSTEDAQLMFNQTSGLINRKGTKVGLIYNVFDIISDMAYISRRETLNTYVRREKQTVDVHIVPTLYIGTNVEMIDTLLDRMVKMGGEGIMLNVYNRGYEHKRSDALLKYKQVKTIDMRVIGVCPGAGKYEDMVGALKCYIRTDDGKEIICEVGTGLSDVQREEWAINNEDIVGKIVKVGFHELTQNREYIGTNMYSLRFPRLIEVRRDKNTTSEY